VGRRPQQITAAGDSPPYRRKNARALFVVIFLPPQPNRYIWKLYPAAADFRLFVTESADDSTGFGIFFCT
jgi:hypothetical protein